MKNINKILVDTATQNKIKKFRFWYLFYLIFYKYITNFMGLFFSLIFPIIWVIVGYFIWGRGNDEANQSYVIMYLSFSLMPVASLGLMSLPINFGTDRMNNITKIYATLNISQEKYLLANYFVILLQTTLIVNVILLMGNFLFIGDVANNKALLIPASEYFAVLFCDLYTFSVCFAFSIGLSLIGKRFSVLFMILLSYYYVNLFLSGTIIPSYTYDPNGQWFKWVQYITPIGSGARLDNMITAHFNPGFAHAFPGLNPDWETDWLAFVSPLLQAGCIAIIVYKVSFWRYHRDINTISYVPGEVNTHEFVKTIRFENQKNY